METPGPRTGPLPASVELLWGLRGPGGRGPRRGLSLEQIVEAAVVIGDADGFGAISMSRIAKELGFTTMSLYRYVDTKDTLVALLFDRVLSEPPAIAPGLPWRAGLEEWAWGQFRSIRRHPWWIDIPLSTPPMGPNQTAWLEAGLRTLADTPFPEPIRLQLLLNLSLYVMGRMRYVRDMSEAATGDSDYTEVMARVLDPDRYPALTAALRNQSFDSDEVDWAEADFGFALARLLDGYDQFLRRFTAAADGADDGMASP
ncbi:TetR/AcrR family transcriptional regulator [Nocardia macrotermitis]|uniref:Tetracycline repressor protein class E n=1 Tax=Nocardia macrotermitis TaxID=2585198 RepID=A0A7K0D7U3_9NOCA|nr:TetR/AcrR family transcriptional regulator [Nocardia macrotermitis]MQY21860.1 Tetracycline repressor protein class E [Nocardia macrotermitis]